MAFSTPPAPPLPRLACLGELAGLEDGKRSASGTYVVQKFAVTAHAGRPAYGNILYKPEWFSPEFDARTLEGGEAAVYRMHIMSGQKNQMSTLAGLCGSEANFKELQDRAENELTEYTDEAVSDFLKRMLLGEFAGANVGYELKQVFDKDEDGRKTIPRDKYEVGNWFWPTDKTLESISRRAEKAAEKAAENGTRATFKAAFSV